jgi:hypothetical protein
MLLMTLFATYYHKKTVQTPLRYLVYLLWFMLVSDFVIARYLSFIKLHNVWWYNIIVNIEIVFYLALFYQYIQRPLSKKVIFIGAVVSELYYLVSFLFLAESWNEWQGYPFALGSFVVILAIFIFLIEFFNTDKIFYLREYLIFWVAIGVLFYLVVAMPLTIAQYYMLSEDYSGSGMSYIQYVANIFMYISFIIGFIWSKRSFK